MRDLEAAKRFWGDTIGLQVTSATPERVYFRVMEERGHHCIVLQHGSEPAARHLGFKVFSEDDLDRAERFFRTKDLTARWVNEPHRGRTLRAVDPSGIPLEFYFAMERLPSIHQAYGLYRGVKPLRIDHFNCFSARHPCPLNCAADLTSSAAHL